MSSKQEHKYNPLAPNRIILSVRCAAYLVDRGHELLYTKPYIKDKERDVYVFKNTIQLYEDVENYIAMREREKREKRLYIN